MIVVTVSDAQLNEHCNRIKDAALLLQATVKAMENQLAKQKQTADVKAAGSPGITAASLAAAVANAAKNAAGPSVVSDLASPTSGRPGSRQRRQILIEEQEQQDRETEEIDVLHEESSHVEL